MFSVTGLFAQKKNTAVNWSVAGELTPMPGQSHTLGLAGSVCGVHDDVMFVAGGSNFPDSMPWQGGKKKYYSDIYIFKKKGNFLSPIACDFKLPESIAYSANCSTPKGVVYAGGENEKGISDKVYLMHWNNIAKSVIIDTLPALPVAVSNADAASYDNIVFITGGESKDGVSDKCWSIDINNLASGWKRLTPAPKPVSHAVFTAIKSDGTIKLYLLGGRRKTPQGISELYNTVYEFDVAKNQWKELPALPYPISAGTGVATGNNSIILFGGDRGTTFSKVENYLAAISEATSDSEKAQLTQQKNQLLAAHPGFSKEVLLYNKKTGKCKTAGTIPFDTPVTTTAFWWNDAVIIPCGEIKAGVRTPKILMAKLRRWQR